MSAKVHENKLKIKFTTNTNYIQFIQPNKFLRWYAPHAGIFAIAAWFIVIGLKVEINIAGSLMSPMYLINSPCDVIAVKAVDQKV